MIAKDLPQVAIVGRPNVGKSTLFNRIVGRRQAIVGREPGMTRDRQADDAEWAGRHFLLVDTGGVEWRDDDQIARAIQEQAFRAATEAQLVLLVVDGKQGLVGIEEQLAREIRRHGIPMILAVNKCDTPQAVLTQTADFHALGIERMFGISAEEGTGVGDLLDAVVAALPPATEAPELPEGTIKVAVIGRPNVGKSSLVNALVGTTRVIVSEVAGTTRDAIDTLIERGGRHYLIIDTAGIRRAARQEGYADWVSVQLARRRLARADVALLVTDAVLGLSRQDVTIAAEAEQAGCGLLVVVNKWDLVGHEGDADPSWVEQLRARMGRVGFAAVAFASAITGRGVGELLEGIDQVQAQRTQRVPTAELNALFERLERSGQQAPPGSPQPKYLTQVGVAPPTFVVFVRGRGQVPASFARYLENRLRDALGFRGSPIRLRFRHGGRDAQAR